LVAGRAAAGALLALLAACGDTDRVSSTGAPRPTPTPTLPDFRPCGTAPPPPGTTHLRPPDPQASRTREALREQRLEDAEVRVEHASPLLLDDGRLRAGNGFDAATASGSTPVPVAPPGTRAQVAMTVVDSDRAGRRVAFVEAQLSAAEPVRWEEHPDLLVVTDGGDGGFSTGTAPVVDVTEGGGDGDDYSHPVIDAYVGAFGSGDGDRSVCVLRRTRGTVDAVLFTTGYGDGVYGIYVGRDAAGEAVSLVSYGAVLPWDLSGLPGTPPPGVS
jgi:hypothetical protein